MPALQINRITTPGPKLVDDCGISVDVESATDEYATESSMKAL
jgi:hypothetical protein